MYVYSASVLDDAELRDSYYNGYLSEQALAKKYSDECSDRHERMHKAWRVMTGAEVDSDNSYADYKKHAENYLAAYNALEEAKMIRNDAEKRAAKFYAKFNN
jgi:hypothetical protein